MSKVFVFILLALSLGGLPLIRTARADTSLGSQATDPPMSTVTSYQPNERWGGRGVAVDVSPSNTAVAIVASESGGLFKTTDSGATWSHIDSLQPFRMVDVGFAPSNASIIIASTLADTHATNEGGIWRSVDGGLSWQKPATSTPPVTCTFTPRPNSQGISFAPDTNDVYVGTDCGVAVSHDLGATWTHVALSRTWSVVASPSGIVATCSDDGVHRSTNNGAFFGPNGGAGCPGFSNHEIAVSPFESNVLFQVTGGPAVKSCLFGGSDLLFESDDNGTTWTQIGQACASRPAWVRTHPSADGIATHFDIYFSGGQDIRRLTCTGLGPGQRCPTLPTPPNVSVDGPGANADTNGMAFTSASSNCPEFVVSDHGVHSTSDCGSTFHITGSGAGGYDALQVYDLVGEVLPHHTDLYFGTQDNQAWASGDNGASWPNGDCGDTYFLGVSHDGTNDAGDPVTGTSPANCGNFYSPALFAGCCPTWVNSPGTGGTPFLVAPAQYIQWSNTTDSGPFHLFFANGIPTSTGSWTDEGATLQSPYEKPYVAIDASGIITVYQPISTTNGVGLVRITGVGTSSVTMAAADNGLNGIAVFADGEGTFLDPAVVGVDPHDPQHLIAADASTNQMMVSTNGGGNWTVDTALTTLVTGNGQFDFQDVDQNPRATFTPLVQAHIIAFDPSDSKRILVGTEANGIIASLDGGRNWFPMFGSSRVTAITDFFFDEVQNDILASSYGRGLWKVNFALSLSVSKFYTDTSLNPLPTDAFGNPKVDVDLASSLVKATNPGGIIAWVNITNTGSLPVSSLKLNETLPVDWTVSPKWLPAKGAIHVFLVNSTILATNEEVTQPSTISVSTGNPQVVQLALSDITATSITHPLLPGQSVLLSVKLTYALVGTSQSASSYPRNYTDTVNAAAWTQVSFGGAVVAVGGSAFFVADAKIIG